MIDIINSYLSSVAPAAVVDTVTQALKVFEQLELQNYDDPFDELLTNANQSDPQEVFDQLVQLVRQTQRSVLAMHGVTVTDEATIPMCTALIEGILAIPGYEDRERVVAICDLDVSTAERFAELMRLVVVEEIDEMLIALEDVSNMLILRVREIATAIPVSYESASEHEHKRFIEKLQQYIQTLKRNDLAVINLLTMGVEFGMPFEVYLKIAADQIAEMEPEKAAEEILGLAYASCDAFDLPVVAFSQHIEKYVQNMDRITRMKIHMTELTMRMVK